MKYEIKGGSFPIVECTLDKDEFMITESLLLMEDLEK